MKSVRTMVLFMAALMLASCSQGKGDEKPDVTLIPVKTGKVRHVQEREFVSVSGTVTSPEGAVETSFLVSGKVIRVIPREGDSVKKGQLLAKIDPTDYTLGLQAAAAQLGQAQVELHRSKDEYARMKFLYKNRSLAGNDFEKFRATYLGDRQRVDQAMANEKLARKHLGDASLCAPSSGFISKRSIEPGQTASPGTPVLEIVKLDPVEINVGVPETDIHLVRIGQTAEVTIPALPERSFEGRVCVINVSADPKTRTYMTRISVPNPDHVLRTGMVAEARIEGDKAANLMVLPAETILRDPQGATIVFVYYPEKGRVYSRRVETGAVYGRNMVIKSGLSGDEQVVFAGQNNLRDGAKVSVVNKSDSSDKKPGEEGAHQ
ncbi:MAG: efflux RND transporter periplasmic adaptor subunit [Syntrophobacteraceae bacterium]|nr:efflux RND transporter periplasmic adaptor subunit [Syntrophobacteraceae bacterium]